MKISVEVPFADFIFSVSTDVDPESLSCSETTIDYHDVPDDKLQEIDLEDILMQAEESATNTFYARGQEDIADENTFDDEESFVNTGSGYLSFWGE